MCAKFERNRFKNAACRGRHIYIYTYIHISSQPQSYFNIMTSDLARMLAIARMLARGSIYKYQQTVLSYIVDSEPETFLYLKHSSNAT